MGPKAPKANRSPFGLFMYAFEYEQRKSIPVQQLVQITNPVWQAMTDEQKMPYEQLSQRIRQQYDNRCDKHTIIREIIDSGLVADNGYRSKKNSNKTANVSVAGEIGEAINAANFSSSKRSIASDFDDESDNELSDELVIEEAIAKLSIDQKDINIIVISFNVVVVTLDGKFYPNEIGLTMLSVTDGIKDKYHKIITCKVPNGYYGPAKQHSDNTHKITPNSDGFEKNYLEIVREIHAFISRSDLSAQTDPKSNAAKKLIFCSPANKSGVDPNPQIVGCLKWLADAVRSMREESGIYTISSTENPYGFDGYRVLDLSLLLYAISKPYESFRPRNVFMDDLLKAIYDFNANISCEFHEHIENRFCALGATIKLAYLFLEPACHYLEVVPTDNHFPQKKSGDICFESSIVKIRPLVKTTRRQRELEEEAANAVQPSVPTGIRPSRVNQYYIGIGRARNNPKH